VSLLPEQFPLPDSLVPGTDFKCADRAGTPLNFCFGIGAGNHATLQLLQQAINQFSVLKGFAQLTVDGFVGTNTVNAVQAILPIDPPWTKEQVTERATGLLIQIDNAARQLEQQGHTLASIGEPVPPAQSVASTGVPSSTGSEIVAATTAPTTAAGIAAVVPKSKLLPWILGGLAVVAAVGVGGFFYHRNRLLKQAGWGDYDDADDLGADEED
jgi:lysozyme family protein